jgi:hypothetical protein
MKVEETMKLTNVMAWAAAALVVLSGGCMNENQNGFFKEEAARDEVEKFSDTQISQGSRNDAQLYAYHFTGGHLNGLGRAKVISMLDNCENCDPIVVHLVDAGDGDLLTQRKASVELYLKTAEGANKLTFHPASEGLIRFNKTESGVIEAAAAPTDGAAPATPAQ